MFAKIKSVLLALLVISLFSCGGQAKKKEVVVTSSISPKAMFISIHKKVQGVKWAKYIDSETIEYKKPLAGNQLGALFVNWVVASLIKEKEASKDLAENIFNMIFRNKLVKKINLKIEKLDILKKTKSVGIEISKSKV